MTLSYLECSRMCSIDSVGHSLGVHRGRKMSTLADVLCDAKQEQVSRGVAETFICLMLFFSQEIVRLAWEPFSVIVQIVTRCHKISDGYHVKHSRTTVCCYSTGWLLSSSTCVFVTSPQTRDFTLITVLTALPVLGNVK